MATYVGRNQIIECIKRNFLEFLLNCLKKASQMELNKIKENLISYAPSYSNGGEEIINFINDELDEKSANECLKYMNELENSGYSHRIEDIGYHHDTGCLYIKVQSGLTFL